MKTDLFKSWGHCQVFQICWHIECSNFTASSFRIWNSSTLKRPWCWERLRAGGEGNNRGWDGWMASPTQGMRVWINSGSWWWTGRPGLLQYVGLQRLGHDWVTEHNWIPSPPLALFVVMLPKAHLTLHSRMSGSRWLITPSWLSGSLVQFSSVAQSCLTLCDPMNRSTSGLPVHHQLLEFTQTHVHLVSDAIQPSHPRSPPSPPAPNPSQHQSLFQWVNSSHEVAKVLEFQL